MLWVLGSFTACCHWLWQSPPTPTWNLRRAARCCSSRVQCSLCSLVNMHFLYAAFQPKSIKQNCPSNQSKLSSNFFFLLSRLLVLKVNCVSWARNSGAINIRVLTLRRCGWARCARTTNQTQCAGWVEAEPLFGACAGQNMTLSSHLMGDLCLSHKRSDCSVAPRH